MIDHVRGVSVIVRQLTVVDHVRGVSTIVDYVLAKDTRRGAVARRPHRQFRFISLQYFLYRELGPLFPASQQLP
eukprot:13953400-Heterocapsa_arctica.AAC.1